jgi:hypothetical protein
MSNPMPCSGPGVLAYRTGVAVAAALLPLLLLTACSHAAQPARPASPPVTLGYCGSNLQVRPDVVLVVCNTDDITAVNLVWSDWGRPTATAKGSATVNLCAYTDCASGDYVSVPIEMTASKIVRCAEQARAYSVLRYKFPDGSPFQGVPASSTGGYFGQGQPVPPANQTVSLTC